MASKEIIERIKREIDIVQVISQYVSLQKIGSSYRGLCPFHSEKTPSFHVNPTLKLYHCFGCGASGDVIKFVQEIEHISFQEALQKLGQMVNIEVNISAGQSAKERYVDLLSKLHNEYKKQLRQSQEAMKYLFDRGFKQEEIERYDFGYCPVGSRLAVQIAAKLSVPVSRLLQYGVVKTVAREYIDLFEGRIIIPIRDDLGRIIAFGGRSIDKREPKYLNSPETGYFSKRSTFFLLDRAKKAVKGVDFAVITEGYFDAIAFHRAGITNAIAVLGTNLSKEHLTKLGSLTKNVILCFDADEAGQRATLKSLKTLIDMSFDVAVALFSEKDPDEVFRTEGADALKNSLKQAVPFEKYIVDFYSKFFDLSSPSGSERFLEQLRVWVQSLLSTQRIQRYENLLKMISTKVAFSISQLTEYYRGQSFQREQTTRSGLPNDEDYVIYLYITHEDLRNELSKIDKSIMSEKARRTLMALENGIDISQQDEEIKKYVFDLLSKIPPGDPLKMLEDIKKRLARKAIEKRLSQIDGKLANCRSEEERSELLKERLKLISSMRMIGGDRSGT
ncbi:MAG TPA: DNA primase [Pseudothermotoga sp.]|nr:DNA primase [Pseudothermotoga sp.]HOK83316.1 DNA primase [Pseudothermotoga sp.]HPP70141.1 DNA primase [Pseudothermotoga sp.]